MIVYRSDNYEITVPEIRWQYDVRNAHERQRQSVYQRDKEGLAKNLAVAAVAKTNAMFAEIVNAANVEQVLAYACKMFVSNPGVAANIANAVEKETPALFGEEYRYDVELAEAVADKMREIFRQNGENASRITLGFVKNLIDFTYDYRRKQFNEDYKNYLNSRPGERKAVDDFFVKCLVEFAGIWDTERAFENDAPLVLCRVHKSLARHEATAEAKARRNPNFTYSRLSVAESIYNGEGYVDGGNLGGNVIFDDALAVAYESGQQMAQRMFDSYEPGLKNQADAYLKKKYGRGVNSADFHGWFNNLREKMWGSKLYAKYRGESGFVLYLATPITSPTGARVSSILTQALDKFVDEVWGKRKKKDDAEDLEIEEPGERDGEETSETRAEADAGRPEKNDSDSKKHRKVGDNDVVYDPDPAACELLRNELYRALERMSDQRRIEWYNSCMNRKFHDSKIQFRGARVPEGVLAEVLNNGPHRADIKKALDAGRLPVGEIFASFCRLIDPATGELAPLDALDKKDD